MTTHRVGWIFVALVVVMTVLAPRRAEAVEPGQVAIDQAQLVYEINRARWDPLGFQERMDEATLPANMTTAPPLSPDLDLGGSSNAKANEMADAGYFGHQSEVTGMWPNELVRVHGYTLPSFLSDDANNVESLFAGSPDPMRALLAFANSPSHRTHIFGEGSFFGAHSEIGVGRSSSNNFWAVHTAYSDQSVRFVTGAVFDDADGDGFLDEGEGFSGARVTVGASQGSTNEAGIYSLQVPRGTHLVTITAGGSEVSTVIEVDGYNVWVDHALGGTEPVVRAYELCSGLRPTILGTAGDDVLHATPDRDVINGLGGDDTVVGLGSDDIVCNVSSALDGGQASAGVDRLAGSNRYATAAEVARDANPGTAEVVYLATGENYPDALAAGPAAAAQGAPILLVTTDSVPSVTARELRRLSPSRVVILGGPRAIDPAVEQAVAQLVPDATLRRLAGPSRFETAVEISKDAFDPGVPVVFVASGLDFPDALIGAPAAYAAAGPMLLVKGDSIPSAVRRELERLRPERIVIVGATWSVGETVEAALGNFAGSVERIAAGSGAATAVEVSRRTFPGGSFVVYVAVGNNFPDALAGGAAVHAGLGPILLVGVDTITDQVLSEVRRLAPDRIVILGGTGVVSSKVEQKLKSALGN